jgi:hypothetical protein
MRRLALCLALLSWLSVAEWKLLERVLYSDPPSVDFVVESVHGVLAGTPIARAWQQRFVGPLAVAGLAKLTGDTLSALKLFSALMLLAANLLLFALLRRRGATHWVALVGVMCLGFTHLILLYKLEYPWDGIDVLIFLTFGHWAARGSSLLTLAPLLLLGAFNHETILYVPFWYLLTRDRKQWLTAAATAAILGALILGTRALFYHGPPNTPGWIVEPVTPLIDNPVHMGHNLAALFVSNWIAGRAYLTIGFVAALAWFGWLAWRRESRRAGIWSLCFLLSVFCFGYTNETRHYLPLIAFWFAYAWPVRSMLYGSS